MDEMKPAEASATSPAESSAAVGDTAAVQPPQPAPLDPVQAERSARNWATFCHLSALLGFVGVPFGHFLGPLVIWLLKRNDHPFVDDQGKEALNFQLSILVYTLASLLLICFCIGIVLLVFIHVLNFVLIIVAAIRASSGERFRYPMAIRFFT